MGAFAGELLEEFAANYFSKLFYFCLRKTGDSYEAEELAADISLNIVTAIQKGTVPRHFPAWVWQIARNRYSVWAERKAKAGRSDSGADISELELADERASLEERWLHKEELRLLRRELSFIASDYRHILVPYYIEDKSVREIARMHGLPEGTVKSKLFRGRDMLKEGMDMAREFGSMSYRPENVGFSCSCSRFGRVGEPWSYLNRLLCKNILLAAYRTPSTGEELAVELGVALPYMEDELERLTEATLLKKTGGKYETSFFILSAQAQDRIYGRLRELAPELTDAVIEAVEYRVRCLEENKIRWHEGYQAYEDMKWVLLMEETDLIASAVWMKHGRAENGEILADGCTKRPNFGEWDIVGYENYDNREGKAPSFVGEHGGCWDGSGETVQNIGIRFSQYRFSYQDICRQTRDWLQFEELEALAAIARGEAAESSAEILQRLEKDGYVKKDEDGYKPAFMVRRKGSVDSLQEEQWNTLHRIRDKAEEAALKQYRFSKDVIMGEFPAFLKEDAHQVAFAVKHIFQLRGTVLEEALRRGYLAYDENEERRMLGVYMEI